MALAIIAIALLAVFRLQAQNLDLLSEASFVTTANQLLQDRIARLQSASDFSQGTDSGRCGPDFQDFSYRSEITAVSGSQDLYKVKVSVYWEQSKPFKALSMETYIRRKGQG